MARQGLTSPVIRTKLQRPLVATDILPRARLLDRLNEGRWRPLTLISAPAGYGKTTLASRWMAACDSPSGWVSLDERDSDLRMFLSYVLAAVRLLFPKAELRTEVLLEASHLPSVSDIARYLLNDLHQITEPFTLVLDDYHNIRGKPVHDFLTELLTYPHQPMHLVLLARRDPPLPIARLRGRGQVTEIRVADLRFTPAEAGEFLNKMLKVPVDDATAALLDEKIEGWVTGLRLAGLYLRDKDDLKRRVQELSGSSGHIVEYLAAEVLSRQKPEIVDHLLESSILDRFCAPLCQALHAGAAEGRNEEWDFDAQRLIERLLKANLFVVPLDTERYWFRYHHLFQDFLQNLLRKQKDAETISRLHKRASDWFADCGLVDEAIRYALAAGDTQAAVRLVVEHRYHLMNNAQYYRLDNWLALLPRDTVAETPLLVTTQAINSLQNGQVEDVYTYTEQAQRMSKEIPPESAEYPALQGEIATLTGVVKAMAGQPATAFVAAQKSLDLLPRQALFFRTLALAAMAVSHQMEGDLNQGVKLLTIGLKDPDMSVSIQARMCFYLCLVNFLDINASGTLYWGRKSLELGEVSQLAHTKGGAQYFLGAVRYLRNELTEAKVHLLGLLDSRAVANVTYVAQACGILAFIYMSEGSPEEAGNVIDQVDENSWEMHDNYSPTIREALRVELALRKGNVDEARQLSIGVDFNRFPPLWMLYVPQLTFIKLLLVEGTDKSLKEAHARLAEMDKEMRRINRKSVLIEVLALYALVCHKSGEDAAALEKLQAALELADPGGWVRNFVDLGAPMAVLLERLDHAQPGYTFARQVLDACRTEAQNGLSPVTEAEQKSRLSEQALVEILSNREMDVLTLLQERLSNKEIAERLFISPETVKTHITNIYRKLEVSGRRQAVSTAREIGLLK